MSDVEEIAHAIAGAGGGALSMIVTYPLVTLSTLAQTSLKKKQEKAEKGELSERKPPPEFLKKIAFYITQSSSWKAAEELTKKRGILGLYSGLESALYGITLTNFIYYYFYEATSNIFLRANKGTLRQGKGLSAIQSIITGAVAGSFTCIGSNPFWVANTRMMTMKKNAENEDDVPNSTLRMILDIVDKDGVKTLFAGVLPALVLVVNPIIQYTIFEQIKNFIVASNGKRSFTAGKAFFIGAFGKLIATFLTYPYITLKSRMHVKKKKLAGDETADSDKLSMYEEIRKILHEEGLEGLYGGLTVKLIQSISTAAFLFYFKEELLNSSVKLVQVFKLLKLRKAIKS